MLKAPISRKKRRALKSSALVIVLFFIVLMTVVTIAFLSRSLTAVKVSASSTGETKSKILAGSASDIVIGDFKQEIIAGSAPNAGTANWPVYVPVTNAASATAPFASTMIPWQNGVPMSGSPATNAIPNMISRSVSTNNVTGTAPYVAYPSFYTAATVPPPRAAGDSTAANPTLSTTAPYTTSKVNSSYPSLNGRLISPAQWNAHYLIPRYTNAAEGIPGGTNPDSTPVANFVTPDWVIVTRSGANTVSTSSPGFGTGGLNDSTLTNTNFAIGRYAYAVYNEGGLLDMNAAGYPETDSGTPGSVGLSSTQASNKSSLALADLSQLIAGTTSLTPAQINNIVGWRNYASAELTSSNNSYGNFKFTSLASGNWLTNFVMGNTNGYLQVIPAPAGVSTPPTDQVFLSRQQLINLTQSLSISSDFLQYMGTFSRALEQPSMVPDPARPLILTGQAPPTASPTGVTPDENNYIGNNDGMGGDNTINPSFLSARVGTAFTRWNGTAAVIGEPLVKTKFALSWLAMVAYNATNTSLPAGFATSASDPDPIKDRFGLTRANTSSPWVYNHGQASIKTLTQVAAASPAREADFAELLKAAIIAGSLAKAGPNLNTPGNNNYQYTLDSSIDLQVIQIMANLIDQQDTDSYPTPITINGHTVYGVEDLPYFYRYHLFSVVDSLPNTILSNSANRIQFGDPTGTTTTATVTTALDYTNPSATPTTTSWTYSGATNSCPTNAPATVYAIAPGTVTASTAGEATFFYVPELWNPHDQNTLASETSTQRPSNFRIYAVTDDPVDTPPTGQWNIGAESQLNGSGFSTNAPPSASFKNVIPETGANDTTPAPHLYHWPISDPQPYAAPASANSTGNNIMCFSDNSGSLFREPTLLWNTNPNNTYPAGVNPTSSSPNSVFGPSVKDANTGVTYYGIIAGKAPVQVQLNLASNPPLSSPQTQPISPDGNYIIQGSTLNDLEYTPAGTYAQISFFLQYQDPNNANNWITYDVKYPDLHGLTSPSLVVNTTATTDYANTYQNVLKTGQFPAHATTFDPRTARWGIGTASSLGEVSTGTFGTQDNNNPPGGDGLPGTTSYLLEPTPNVNYNAATLGQFSVMETDRSRGDKGNQVNYSNPCMTSNPGQNVQMHWFSGVGFSASNGQSGSPLQFNGLFSENNPAILLNSRGGAGNPQVPAQTSGNQLYVEDADGVARLAMGAYAGTSLTDTSMSSLVQTTANIYIASDPSRIGLPEATADQFLANNAVSTPTSQAQSRPIVLNRPFRSVSEMSYAFRGTPWKNIDFFTPASGDSALLDTFCLTEPPPNAMVAGKVDLNTRQIPVLQALVAGAYRDESNNLTNSTSYNNSYSLPALSSAEANNVATKLLGITTDTTHAWRGPLKNISSLVGHFVANPGSTSGFTDVYTYTPASPNSGEGQLSSMTYAGLSAALDSTVYTNTTNSASASAPYIQRFREAGIRPLAAAGQVRVWNLLIDVVAQTGHYPKTATGLDQFLVDGQTRLWVHVAIDRYTGQVIDKQVEVVTP